MIFYSFIAKPLKTTPLYFNHVFVLKHSIIVSKWKNVSDAPCNILPKNKIIQKPFKK